MNGEDSRSGARDKEGSYRDFGPQTSDPGPRTFSQIVLLVFSFICWTTRVYAQSDVPVPPLEEGALLIFHPVVVHFAIALTCFGAVLDWCGSLGKQSIWQQTGKICFLAGIVTVGLATLSGWIEHELPRPPSAFDVPAQNVLFYHEYGGYALTGFFLVLAIFRIGMSERLPLFFILLSGVGLVGLLIQGYLGGELVYRYGTGVRAVQVLTSQLPVTEQKKAPEETSEAESNKE